MLLNIETVSLDQRTTVTAAAGDQQLTNVFIDECKAGHPVQVGYSDTVRATGVVTRRARTRAWFVWGDTTKRQPRTCEWTRAVAVARSMAAAVARGSHRRC